MHKDAHEIMSCTGSYQNIILDGGEIVRVMFVDWKDEKLKISKPGHNITFCPDEKCWPAMVSQCVSKTA